jgi:hypothetical protein
MPAPLLLVTGPGPDEGWKGGRRGAETGVRFDVRRGSTYPFPPISASLRRTDDCGQASTVGFSGTASGAAFALPLPIILKHAHVSPHQTRTSASPEASIGARKRPR